MTDAAPKPAANPRHKWYIVHAYSNFEKKVAEQLRDQAKQQGLEDAFSEILVPTEDVIEIRRGKKVNADGEGDQRHAGRYGAQGSGVNRALRLLQDPEHTTAIASPQFEFEMDYRGKYQFTPSNVQDVTPAPGS